METTIWGLGFRLALTTFTRGRKGCSILTYQIDTLEGLEA